MTQTPTEGHQVQGSFWHFSISSVYEPVQPFALVRAHHPRALRAVPCCWVDGLLRITVYPELESLAAGFSKLHQTAPGSRFSTWQHLFRFLEAVPRSYDAHRVAWRILHLFLWRRQLVLPLEEATVVVVGVELIPDGIYPISTPLPAGSCKGHFSSVNVMHWTFIIWTRDLHEVYLLEVKLPSLSRSLRGNCKDVRTSICTAESEGGDS
mmetsp:Transcript_63242/g.112425  ORF Transcript_63242/g.112425 Transcript_63242/m.112425 type:complete len:209 (-) Transcript_63242:1453-2079(-)